MNNYNNGKLSKNGGDPVEGSPLSPLHEQSRGLSGRESSLQPHQNSSSIHKPSNVSRSNNKINVQSLEQYNNGSNNASTNQINMPKFHSHARNGHARSVLDNYETNINNLSQASVLVSNQQQHLLSSESRGHS
jgi:hypothetical protein